MLIFRNKKLKYLFSFMALLVFSGIDNPADAAWRTLKLESIQSIDQDDEVDVDELYLKIAGKKIPIHNMRTGDVKSLRHVAPIRFENKVEIQLWDRDFPDDDDNGPDDDRIGSWVVRDSEALNRVHNASFQDDDDTRYVVRYRITK